MSASDDDAASWPAAEHAILHAPWRQRLPSGELGPEYGPRTPGALHRAVEIFRCETRGGIGSESLWDAEEAARSSGRAPATCVSEVVRADAAEMVLWLEAAGHRLPERQLQAASMAWRDRMSIGRIAKAMQVAGSTVREWIRRTREAAGK